MERPLAFGSRLVLIGILLCGSFPLCYVGRALASHVPVSGELGVVLPAPHVALIEARDSATVVTDVLGSAQVADGSASSSGLSRDSQADARQGEQDVSPLLVQSSFIQSPELSVNTMLNFPPSQTVRFLAQTSLPPDIANIPSVKDPGSPVKAGIIGGAVAAFLIIIAAANYFVWSRRRRWRLQRLQEIYAENPGSSEVESALRSHARKAKARSRQEIRTTSTGHSSKRSQLDTVSAGSLPPLTFSAAPEIPVPPRKEPALKWDDGSPRRDRSGSKLSLKAPSLPEMQDIYPGQPPVEMEDLKLRLASLSSEGSKGWEHAASSSSPKYSSLE